MAAPAPLRKLRGFQAFLGADLVAFLALFAGYIYLRRQSAAWPLQFHFASGLISFSMTLFAFSGSFAMHYAARRQALGSYEIAMRLVIATVAVWVSVMILMVMEWARLIFIMEVTPWSGPFGGTYFVLTGFYLLHLAVGVIYLGIVASRIRVANCLAAAYFAHFTNIVWLFIFVGVYLAGTDLRGL